MGSYSELTLAGYPICRAKNSYFEDVVKLIFLPDDFVEEKRPNSSRNILIWGDAYINDNNDYLFQGFVKSAKICKERLQIFGASLKRARNDFNSAKKIAKESYGYSFSIEKVSFTNYIKEVNYILKNKIINYDELNTNLRESLVANELCVIGQSTFDYLYILIGLLNDEDIIEYNLTEVITGGWVKKLEAKNIEIEKIIVLTEGKSDTEFITASIKLLYPYLHNYYQFIAFDEYSVKLESNASALVRLVISFAASNIKHPIIALFDNDTTGMMEMGRLLKESLPINIKILRLPDLKLAIRYPTLGPTGIKKMNINGLACGIELYLGEDVLKKAGKLIPVLWTGYNEYKKLYQGEISDKKYVHEKFKEKIKKGNTSNMQEMNALLKTIFNSFQ